MGLTTSEQFWCRRLWKAMAYMGQGSCHLLESTWPREKQETRYSVINTTASYHSPCSFPPEPSLTAEGGHPIFMNGIHRAWTPCLLSLPTPTNGPVWEVNCERNSRKHCRKVVRVTNNGCLPGGGVRPSDQGKSRLGGSRAHTCQAQHVLHCSLPTSLTFTMLMGFLDM